MRFLLDENVDSRVRRVFTSRGHDCWTVGEANLAGDSDDEVTVYATDHRAVVVTHDVEFSRRRESASIGRHLQLRCDELDAAGLLAQYFDAVLTVLDSAEHVFVRLGSDGPKGYINWHL